MSEICKGYVPQNTDKATTWAMRVFKAWRIERNKVATDKCPDNLLESPDIHNLNRWLSRLVVECRREDGAPYPPSSISNILAGLYRYSRNCSGDSCPNFMNRKDPNFRELTGALQVRFRELREEGIGAQVNHAPVVTPEEEEMLWGSKVIGDHTPLTLQRAVFVYVGKAFWFRGGEEQRKLKRSQFHRSLDPDCYKYIENGSKNITGVNPTENNKIVPVYAQPDAQPRCLVYLLDKYFDKFPADTCGLDVFYLHPKVSVTNKNVWYDCAPVGAHKLKIFLECMCKEAGISQKKTNHSLRATGASALFNAGVPEKLIRGVTGHRSKALQLHERHLNSSRRLLQCSCREKNNFAPGRRTCLLLLLRDLVWLLQHCLLLLWHLYLMLLAPVY